MQYRGKCITIFVYLFTIYISPLLYKITNYDIFNKDFFCHRYLTLFLIVVLLNRKLFLNDFKIIKKINFKSLMKEWALMFIGYMILCLVLTNILPANMNESHVASYGNSLAMVLIVNCIGPITEEIVFRISISGCFKNDNIGIILSAVLFGVIHTFDYCIKYNDWLQLLWSIPYIFIGLALGWVYKKYKNVYTIFLGHMLINLIATIGG